MSLNWDLTKVADREQHYPSTADGRMNPVTERMIWATLGVGLSGITEKNAAEFYARLHLLEVAYANLPDRYMTTPADVRLHTGLVTNVTDMARPAWLRRYTANHTKESLDAAVKDFASTKTWRPAPDCHLRHAYGEEDWRPAGPGVHEHLVAAT